MRIREQQKNVPIVALDDLRAVLNIHTMDKGSFVFVPMRQSS